MGVGVLLQMSQISPLGSCLPMGMVGTGLRAKGALDPPLQGAPCEEMGNLPPVRSGTEGTLSGPAQRSAETCPTRRGEWHHSRPIPVGTGIPRKERHKNRFYRFIFKKQKQMVKKVLHFQPCQGCEWRTEQAEEGSHLFWREVPLPPRGATQDRVCGRQTSPLLPCLLHRQLIAASRFARPSVGVGGQRLPSPNQWSLQLFFPSEVVWASPLGSQEAGRRLSLTQPAHQHCGWQFL